MLSSAATSWGPDRELGMESHLAAGPIQWRFSPYAFNGGTVLAIAGEDFSIVASDTRLSEGYSIHTRDSPKCYKLTDKTVIGCSGFHGDCLTLTKIIEARLKMYKHSNNKAMTTGAIAAMLSTILYSRRFFPYYVYNIIGGLDEEGVTCHSLTGKICVGVTYPPTGLAVCLGSVHLRIKPDLTSRPRSRQRTGGLGCSCQLSISVPCLLRSESLEPHIQSLC